jgi:hypothetical protein
MRYGSLGQNSGASATEEARAPGSATAAVGVKEIPYDYVATFKLTGERGKRIQDVITISTEGTFVAVSVGYSFVPSKDAVTGPGPIPAQVDAALKAMFAAADVNLAFKALAESVLLRAGGVQFLYTIVDSGSGRELQNKSVHNIAGLGEASGERPFRPFARPVQFVPRATIRIEIEELSVDPLFRDGTLFLVLHGYKRLGE